MRTKEKGGGPLSDTHAITLAPFIGSKVAGMVDDSGSTLVHGEETLRGILVAQLTEDTASPVTEGTEGPP